MPKRVKSEAALAKDREYQKEKYQGNKAAAAAEVAAREKKRLERNKRDRERYQPKKVSGFSSSDLSACLLVCLTVVLLGAIVDARRQGLVDGAATADLEQQQ